MVVYYSPRAVPLTAYGVEVFWFCFRTGRLVGDEWMGMLVACAPDGSSSL